jgi:predicted ribosome quality control (RQC) complex YloA/Tae2 family protein
LIGLQQIGFIDTSLFEEELSLYGVIGRGIALALAQCEELEGCAPNVTDEELSQLIASIEGRIVELEQRLAETENEADKATLEELLAGFRQELENYLSYRDQLAEYTSGEDEEDLGEDSFGEEAPAPADTVAGDVERLTRILEVTRERINWLESLKANPEERARLGEATSIDLTEEALDEIIDATRREAESLESQIRLLQDGTEARHPMPDEKPEFWAEAGDVFNILHVQYGPSLASAGDGIVTASELRY